MSKMYAPGNNVYLNKSRQIIIVQVYQKIPGARIRRSNFQSGGDPWTTMAVVAEIQLTSVLVRANGSAYCKHSGIFIISR